MKKYIVLCVMLLMTSVVYAQEVTEEPPVSTRESLPDATNVELEFVAGGFNRPIFVTHARDGSGRLFVVEQSGRIWVLNSEGVLQNTPFLNIFYIVSQDVLNMYSERGLLGLAFHPDFAENGLFYVNYTDAGANHATKVVEFTVSVDEPNIADADSARELLTIGQPYDNHNGGHLAFGPDEYLYIAVGDGGLANDPLQAGQNSFNLLGTILRIDVNESDENRAYSIPDDNPFHRDPTFAPEVWAWGLRNPWRFSFDRLTGDLYIGDVGQELWEEVNFQPAESIGGENYGWAAYEGTHEFWADEAASEIVMPVAEYDHSTGSCSVTGGYVYRGEAIPEFEGVYLYSDYCNGRIWALYRDNDGEWHSDEIMNLLMSVSSFGEDEDGELYVLDYTLGRVLKFVPIEEGG